MALTDPFYRLVGRPTPVEAGNARREKVQISRSEEPRDRFATAIADAMATMDPVQARKVFQGLREVRLSSDPDVRWTTTAAAARRLADESVALPVQSLDAPLSRSVGVRALSEAADNVREKAQYGIEPGERIESILENKREIVSRQTRAFMSTGPAAQQNARTQANDLFYNGDQPANHKLPRDVGDVVGQPTTSTRREWLLKAVEARMAAAQIGALPADRTVEAAMDASRQGHMIEGRIAQTPDRARNERLQGTQRVDLIREQVARNNAPPPSMRQHVLSTEEQLARHGITATPSGKAAASPSDRAAIARGLSASSRNR